MEKFAILKMNQLKDIIGNDVQVDEVFECDENGIKLFDSLDEAHYYQEENSIDGRCVEIPLY